MNLTKNKAKIYRTRYQKLYPTGSCPAKIYSTPKIHNKIPVKGKIDDLPIRSLVSNTNTVTYNLAKYLSKLLAPLRELPYTIKGTKDFIEKVKAKAVPNDDQIVSFDVKSLFTKVPLDLTIYLVLRRI